MISWFRYVSYGELLLAMACGWQPVADLGDSHGQYAVLCAWTGEEEPRQEPSAGPPLPAPGVEIGP